MWNEQTLRLQVYFKVLMQNVNLKKAQVNIDHSALAKVWQIYASILGSLFTDRTGERWG